jgi:hypothetical protein
MELMQEIEKDPEDKRFIPIPRGHPMKSGHAAGDVTAFCGRTLCASKSVRCLYVFFCVELRVLARALASGVGNCDTQAQQNNCDIHISLVQTLNSSNRI